MRETCKQSIQTIHLTFESDTCHKYTQLTKTKKKQ